MTGYQSKKAAAQAKLDDADDTQVYGDALTIAYQSGYYDGKKATQRPWVGLTPQDLNEIFAVAMTGEGAVNLALEKIKEKNT
jgi:hypothetical protein